MRGRGVLLAMMILAAQGAAAQEVSYGAKAGVSFATLSFDPSSEVSYGLRTGVTAGGLVAFPIGSRLTIQPEGLFTQKGAKVDDLGVSATIEIDYIEVPVLAKYTVAGGPARSFHVFGGPSVAFKVHSSSSATLGGSTVEIDNGDRIEDIDYGVVMGAGMTFDRFTVEGRFTLGLANIDAEDPDESKARTRAVGILVGVRF
jgi:Outer membrane protein beta-barrel domain